MLDQLTQLLCYKKEKKSILMNTISSKKKPTMATMMVTLTKKLMFSLTKTPKLISMKTVTTKTKN